MSLVINKYKILNLCLAFDPDYTGPAIDVPESFTEGATFEGIKRDREQLKNTNKCGSIQPRVLQG